MRYFLILIGAIVLAYVVARGLEAMAEKQKRLEALAEENRKLVRKTAPRRANKGST